MKEFLNVADSNNDVLEILKCRRKSLRANFNPKIENDKKILNRMDEVLYRGQPRGFANAMVAAVKSTTAKPKIFHPAVLKGTPAPKTFDPYTKL